MFVSKRKYEEVRVDFREGLDYSRSLRAELTKIYKFIEDISKIDPSIKERFGTPNNKWFEPNYKDVSDYLKLKHDSERYAELKKKFGGKK